MNAFENLGEYAVANGYDVVELPPIEPTELDVLTLKVAELTEQRDNFKTAYQALVNSNLRLHNSVKDWLLDCHSDKNISSDVANQLAELMGFGDTKTVTVTGTISFSGDVEVALFTDLNNVSSFDFSIENLDLEFETERLYNLSFDIEDIDLES